MTVPLLGPHSAPADLARDGGGKAAHLAELDALGVRVPMWRCIPATVFDEHCARSGVAQLAAPRPTMDAERAFAQRIAALFAAVEPSVDLRALVRAALATPDFTDAQLAVRSSGIGEDSAQRSFAGQYDSLLFQRGEAQVLAAIRHCWASAYSARNLSYRRQSAASDAAPRMGVILQRMIDSEVAGVAFSRNPLQASDRASVVVDSVFGQGEGLVSGELDADHFLVDRDSLAINATIATKERARVRDDGGGTTLVAVDATRAARPSLADDQVREVARLALTLEHALGTPQDIEWSYAAGQLYCLQARPITTLPPDAVFDPAVNGDDVVIWDNSNIIESFAGVTTPLTFTHVNRCYREVYLQYCRVMGVPRHVIAANESIFRNMLGLVRGRVYYNLVNWYRLLGLFPGASASKGFMETMMGVRQSLPPSLSQVLTPGAVGARYPLPTRVAVLLRTLYRLTRTTRYINDFMARVDRVSRSLEAQDLRALSVPRQVDVYRLLETDVLQHWTAPIVNDTRCMVAFGVLGALTIRWVARAGDDIGSLRNDLLCGEGDLKSTEPTKWLMRIATRVNGDPSARQLFLDSPPDVVWASLRAGAAPSVFEEFNAFLREFGFRCVNELKLEEPDLHDDPRFVVASVQSYLRLGSFSIATMEEREAAIRQRAEGVVRERLGPMRRALYFAVLRWARRAVSDRELLRFERTRMFGITRRLFRGIGANFVKLGLIDTERDIFYLTLEEILSFHEGRSLATEFGATAALRRAEFDEYRTSPAPPDRFVTRGSAATAMRYPNVLLEADLLAAESASDDPNVLRGTPCSPGVVEAPVRIAETLADAEGISREILVTERTDPGWVPVFPACAGLIIERGSLLSHSAVVARELGVPTIVGVSGKPMQRLKTGQRVRMDGGRGEVHIL